MPSPVWSKIILITGGLGGADHPTSKKGICANSKKKKNSLDTRVSNISNKAEGLNFNFRRFYRILTQSLK